MRFEKRYLFDVQRKNACGNVSDTEKWKKVFYIPKIGNLPWVCGGGIGSYCLTEIERLAKDSGCIEVVCEVYDKSEHAKKFYEHRGYTAYGASETLKYKEWKMRKAI